MDRHLRESDRPGIPTPLSVAYIHEMLSQNEQDYVFDSSKIERVFELAVTPVHEGVTQIVTAARAMAKAT